MARLGRAPADQVLVLQALAHQLAEAGLLGLHNPDPVRAQTGCALEVVAPLGLLANLNGFPNGVVRSTSCASPGCGRRML
jgi:hypothetical protein